MVPHHVFVTKVVERVREWRWHIELMILCIIIVFLLFMSSAKLVGDIILQIFPLNCSFLAHVTTLSAGIAL